MESRSPQPRDRLEGSSGEGAIFQAPLESEAMGLLGSEALRLVWTWLWLLGHING